MQEVGRYGIKVMEISAVSSFSSSISFEALLVPLRTSAPCSKRLYTKATDAV